jgi:hypothetical protein
MTNQNAGTPEKRERNEAIRILVRNGATQQEVAHLFGLSRQRVWQILNKEKDQAHGMNRARRNNHPADVRPLVKRSGRLMVDRVKPPLFCSGCKTRTQLEMHHIDYSKPKEVIWLCRTCHIRADMERRQQELARVEELMRRLLHRN